MHIRYSAAACQTDLPNPIERRQMRSNTDRMLQMVDAAVEGSAPEASPGPGERIVVAPIDIAAVRHERESRRGHHMLAHLRTEAYPVYAQPRYPRAIAGVTYEGNVARIDAAKKRLTGGFA